ncbi:unnamed protein product, partial [Meganyctiphanes norvegica]
YPYMHEKKQCASIVSTLMRKVEFYRENDLITKNELEKNQETTGCNCTLNKGNALNAAIETDSSRKAAKEVSPEPQIIISTSTLTTLQVNNQNKTTEGNHENLDNRNNTESGEVKTGCHCQGRAQGGEEGAVALGPRSSRGPRELQLKKKFNSLALLVSEIQGIL